VAGMEVGAWCYDHMMRSGAGMRVWIENTFFFFCHGNKRGTIEGLG